MSYPRDPVGEQLSIDLDADEPAATASAAGGRLSWAATSRLGQLLLVAAAVFAVFAVVTATQAVRQPVVRQLRTVAGPVAPAVDVTGCPVGARCRTSSSAPAGLLAAVRRAFPTGRLSSVAGTYDADTGAPYRVTMFAEVGAGAVLS
ncbi:MAG: hypothetical protein ACR2N4_14955, partial [Jatrophihabitans sp.]